MKKIILVILLLVIIIAIRYHVLGYKYQRFITEILVYQGNADLLMKDEIPSIDTTNFNFSEYLNLFDRLKIETGYTLDYVYLSSFLDGSPILIALNTNESFDSLVSNFMVTDSIINNENVTDYHQYISYEIRDYTTQHLNPLNHLIVEDSKMGYFQFVTFEMIADKFGLFWHSGYGRKEIICTKFHLLFRIRSIPKEDILKSQRRKAFFINPKPKVSIKKNFCTVEILRFNDWSGLIKDKFKISRNFPNKIELMSSDTLIHYSCRVIY